MELIINGVKVDPADYFSKRRVISTKKLLRKYPFHQLVEKDNRNPIVPKKKSSKKTSGRKTGKTKKKKFRK